jgi:hypothetical protein
MYEALEEFKSQLRIGLD